MTSLLLSTKSFYFIRRETKWNARKLISGQKDIPLTPKGREQALKQASLIDKLNIVILIVNPLKRTKETASLINNQTKLPIIYDERLKERFWSSWEGTPHTKYLSKLKDSELPPAAENYSAFEGRASSCLNHL